MKYAIVIKWAQGYQAGINLSEKRADSLMETFNDLDAYSQTWTKMPMDEFNKRYPDSTQWDNERSDVGVLSLSEIVPLGDGSQAIRWPLITQDGDTPIPDYVLANIRMR